MKPLVVGIGGSPFPGSSTERAVALALRRAEQQGARTVLLGASALARLPMFLTQPVEENEAATEFVRCIREADGLIIGSPGYHGSVSGLVKNALDYIEATAKDERPYLTDLPVGIMGVAAGTQASMGVVLTLRTIVHALRGWPTPFAATLGGSGPLFGADGQCQDPAAQAQIDRVGDQVAQRVMQAKAAAAAANAPV
jgi:FMN reductase